ncbi:hypothetical protein SUDANB105_05218 [Streptomyces sp. enrichment culture]|uniref:hypothetical protein n=1 Tax=Streptomyces sp. enrichment culture TaxID=1795815 RepID=UPI003F572E34
MNASDNDRLARIKATVERLRREYADDPNIVTVGWGLPRRGGDLTDELAVIVHVRQKLGTDRGITAAGSQPVPREVDGFPTDVQAHRIKPAAGMVGQRDETQYDPLRGGVASSNAANHIAWFNGAGTLGLLARDATTNAAVALSNWHVWGDGGETGDDIIQPGRPTETDHLEAVGKIAACNILAPSLIEWEVPSPLTVGLYGGAAALALAAALSDVRDPSRRGQDATIPPGGAYTLDETVDVAIEYPDLPIPGRPFATDVHWQYTRRTDQGEQTLTMEERQVNSQFLLGKLVEVNRDAYHPGEAVQVTAAIWDYQSRGCQDYHVVAHFFPREDPGRVLQAVLAPTTCYQQQPELRCVTFDDIDTGPYPPMGHFAWLRYLADVEEVRVVNWPENDRGVLIPDILDVSHPLTDHVQVTIAHAGNPVTVVAFNAAGLAVATATTPAEFGVAHELELAGPGIAGAEMRGGSGLGCLLRYCVEAVGEDLDVDVPEPLSAALRRELGESIVDGRRLHAQRCCFTALVPLPPDALKGSWEVHVSVQNLNTVPPGTPPEEAATVIGGHLLSSHTTAEARGCAAVMLADHVFDVF